MTQHPVSAQLAVLLETCRALPRMRGEVASTSLAELVVRRYGGLGPEDRTRFFAFLLDELSPDPVAVDAAIDAHRAGPGPDTAQALHLATESPRLALFRSLNTAAGGLDTLLAMRTAAIACARDEPALVPVERDLAHLLGSWFNRGFLTLERIDWGTPATVLERLIAYEAVHEIRGWDDLRRRLEHDRRCFGFFHPLLPDEPLIFVEVALTVGLPGSIHDLIDAPVAPPEETAEPDAAIFYSITNCQTGLAGIPLGNFLIKQVTEELRATVPGLALFSTLSPVPGFARWVRDTGGGLTRPVREAIVTLASADARDVATRPPDDDPTIGADDDPGDGGWVDDPVLRDELLRSCARYLVRAKQDNQPRDPVARFHLRNGARLERINWAGDRSVNGMRQSFGILVNYVYDLDLLAEHHEAYANEFRVAHSAAVAALVGG